MLDPGSASARGRYGSLVLFVDAEFHSAGDGGQLVDQSLVPARQINQSENELAALGGLPN